jgi:purine-nucleoside phosphorylase
MRPALETMAELGAETLLLTNSAGSVDQRFAPGDLMLISDHINMLGDNPLVGRNDDRLGPRFPDMSAPYDPTLRALAREVAVAQRLTLREGVYVAVAGPNLETRAEYRMLRALGADVVGMSTVPEVIVAVHGGMRVLGMSIITDQCLPDALEPASLEKILAVAGGAEPKLTALVRGVLERL